MEAEDGKEQILLSLYKMFPATTETFRAEWHMSKWLFSHIEIKTWIAGKWKLK